MSERPAFEKYYHFSSVSRLGGPRPPLNDARFVKEQWVRANDDATRTTTAMPVRVDSAVYDAYFDPTRRRQCGASRPGSDTDGRMFVVRDRGFAVVCGGIRGRRCARPRRAEDDDG